MAFVNEYISDADKARIDFSQIKHPLFERSSIYPSQWTIDRQQDIALIPLGGGGAEYSSFFILYWKGQVIDVFANSVVTGDFPTNDMEVTWNVFRVGVLPEVERAVAMTTLKEALETFGYTYTEYRDQVKSVTVEFIQ